MTTFRDTATSGCRNIDSSDGELNGLSWYAFVVQENTTFTHFRVNGINALAAYGLNGRTLRAGAYISVPQGEVITAITIASGSVIGYIE